LTDAKAPQIAALVLTHNAPNALARCVEAIGSQTQLPTELVVVDNASDPPVDAASLPSVDVPVRVLRSDTNLGPAGGWAIALRNFLANECSHAWLMDDDIVPEPECLDRLWSAVSDTPSSAFAVPVSIQPDGEVGRWGSWCGFVIAREIVEQVGLPREELFWWAEDTEYCHWRLPKAGYPLRFIEDAVVHHDAIRQGGDLPAWKYYYESRNMLYYHWHIMHRTGRYPRNAIRLVGRAMFRQKEGRLRCLAAFSKGLFDGAFGRLGIRYPIVPLRERDLRATPAGRGDAPSA
jgi:rhamnopyranosyl-N-acetylglucosaminyl-diphospho-decaprenol beta-1,3/1,4-galactofuranosyltransferase